MKKQKAAPAKNKSLIRANVHFTGRVQGVGFRYTAEKLAMDAKLVGWVKNLHDGRVELECEGTRERINQFFEDLRASFVGKGIKKMDCIWSDATGEFDEFRIEFHY